MTAHDLTSGLKRRGYTEDVAEAICRRLQENRLIDDTRYAERYVELHKAAQTGRYALRRKMRAKGLDESLVDGLLEENLDDKWPASRARAHWPRDMPGDMRVRSRERPAPRSLRRSRGADIRGTSSVRRWMRTSTRNNRPKSILEW